MRIRPLCIATICYIIGTLMGLYLQTSMVFFLCACITINIFIYLILHKKSILILGIFIFIGFCNVRVVDSEYRNQYQDLKTKGEYTIEGIIVSERVEKEYKTIYEIEVTTIDGAVKYEGKRWILQVKKSNNIKNTEYLKFGDLVEIYGTVEIPTTARNYMGFDYRQYLKSQKIYGTISTKQEVEIKAHNQARLFDTICYCVKDSINKRLYEILPEGVAQLCTGILLGEKQNLEQEVVDYFKESNLTHMLAVSGAHISYIVLGLTILLNKTRYKFRKIFIIIFLLFFMGLTGFTLSVQRSCIMTILALIGSLLHRKQDILTTLCFSSLIILICNPYAILDVGFQLSYGGTLGIILFFVKIENGIYRILHSATQENIFEIKKYIISAIGISLSANLIIIPIMAFHFNTISFSFWISNLLAGSLLGVIIVLGVIVYIISLFTTSIASIIAVALNFFAVLLIKIAKICSNIPFSSLIVRTPYFFEIAIYYLLITAFCLEKENRIKQYVKQKIIHLNNISLNQKLKIITWVVLLVFSVSLAIKWIYPKGLEIYFVDVGQGDCTFIRTLKGKTILIDGGGSEIGTFDVGEKTLLPYLLDRKIMKIDYMIISHFDSDHVGGLLYITDKIKVKQIIIGKQFEDSENYQELIKITKEKKIKIAVVEAGQRLKIEKDLYFDVLWPDSKNVIGQNNINNNSLVCKMIYNNFSVLFTGDIEEIAEKAILERYKNNEEILKSIVLKTAHHGSKTSSTKSIIERIQPKIALIGVGEKNTFGHPNEGVLERLEQMRV